MRCGGRSRGFWRRGSSYSDGGGREGRGGKGDTRTQPTADSTTLTGELTAKGAVIAAVGENDLGLDIALDDAGGMRCVECVRDLDTGGKQQFYLDRPPR